MEGGSKIYVAGHMGLVGSAIVRELRRRGCGNIVVRSHAELDLTDRVETERFFREEAPDYVFLAAARVGGIRENSNCPAEFIYENIMMQTNVIDLSFRYGVKRLLFPASSCVYPKICPQPIKEGYLMTGPPEPTNEPFTVAKLAGIKMCQAYNAQHGTNFIPAVAANVYGVNDRFDDSGHVIPSLIKRFHAAKARGEGSVCVWGSGTARREFLYADDLGEACVFLMNEYDRSEIINIGTGIDTSIAALSEVIRETVGFGGEIIYDRRMPDGMPARLLDSSRINAMGWKAKTGLKEGLGLTYRWYETELKEAAT